MVLGKSTGALIHSRAESACTMQMDALVPVFAIYTFNDCLSLFSLILCLSVGVLCIYFFIYFPTFYLFFLCEYNHSCIPGFVNSGLVVYIVLGYPYGAYRAECLTGYHGRRN